MHYFAEIFALAPAEVIQCRGGKHRAHSLAFIMKLSTLLRQQLEELKESDRRLQESYKTYLKSAERLATLKRELNEPN